MTRVRKALTDHRNAAARALEATALTAIEDAVNVLWQRRSGRIYTAGNGGSAATASHFAADLGKAAGGQNHCFHPVCLNDNVPALTAWTNDEGWDAAYWRSLSRDFTARDTLVLFTVNGGQGFSDNLRRAADYARRAGGVVITFTGREECPLARMSSVLVAVPDVGDSLRTPIAEGLHSVYAHLVVWTLRGMVP